MFYEHLKAFKRPNKLAFIEDNATCTFAGFLSRVERCMTYLYEQGARDGDKIAFAMANCSDFMVLFYASTAMGCVAVPLNTMLKASDYKYIFDDCKPKLIVASAHLEEVFKARKDVIVSKASAACDFGVSEDLQNELSGKRIFDDYHNCVRSPQLASAKMRSDLSHIIYTSGTTGLPKGVMLSFGNLLSNIEGVQKDFRITKHDRFIAYLPMFHSFTLTAVCMLPLLSGCTLVIKRSVMPFSEVLKAILKHRVSVLFSVPAILSALLKAKLPWYFRWFHRIRIIISGGSSLAPNLLDEYKRKWRRTAILEGYGLSECSPIVSVNTLQAARANSVGTPLGENKVMVVDDDFNAVMAGCEGELVVSGECVMLGYLNKPELTAEVMEGNWLRTGDIARIDEYGFIYIIDRKKDIIISKGINIYPREIEDILSEHPDINASAIIGAKTKDFDECVAAYIELNEGASLTSAQVLEFLRPKLASYKIPKYIEFVDELPKNAAGKVLKKNLKERLVGAKS